jgi:aldehyde dehydrogenase family 7 protein A1
MLTRASLQRVVQASGRRMSSRRAEIQNSFDKYPCLGRLGLNPDGPNHAVWTGKEWRGNGETMHSVCAATGDALAEVVTGNEADYEACLESMMEAQESWAATPPPKRGDVIRQIGNKLRDNLDDFGALVTLEMGKIKSEGVGEVVEYIDMCDLAAGMSRQLPGQVFTSERFEHTMLEQWNPLGSIGIITAFNFPCAVHGWNSCNSFIAGNTQIWKGSPSTPLVSIVQTRMMAEVLEENGIHGGVSTLCQGGIDIGKTLVADERLNLISFTGSTHVGRDVAGVVAQRFGKSILELGGNNPIVVMDDADLESVIPTILFAAAGTYTVLRSSFHVLFVISLSLTHLLPPVYIL